MLVDMFLACLLNGELGELSSLAFPIGIGTGSIIVDPLMLPWDGYLLSLVLT